MAKIERSSDLLFDKWPQKVGAAPVADITSDGEEQRVGEQRGEGQRGEEQRGGEKLDGEQQRTGEQRRKTGRPKIRAKDKRRVSVTVQVNAAEMDSLREWAARRGKRLGVLAREMLLALAERDQ